MSIYASTFTDRLNDSWDRQLHLIQRDVLSSLLLVSGYEVMEYAKPSREEDVSGIDLWVITPGFPLPIALRDKDKRSMKYNDFTLTKTHATGANGEFYTSTAKLYVFSYWDENKPIMSRLVDMISFLPDAWEDRVPHTQHHNKRNGQTFAAISWDHMDPYVLAIWRTTRGPQA